MQIWTSVAPAVTAAFLASLVEVVEAFTIVLAVATVRGWRPALIGTAAGLALLCVLVAAFGPLIGLVPLAALQLVIGVLLLLFGMRWLRKAILRAGGRLSFRDEAGAYQRETETLRSTVAPDGRRLDWFAGIVAFKAVVIEGIEVVFIVLAVGAGNGMLLPAAAGALAAALVILAIGLMIRAPLARVPENTLKFCVGVMLSAFGIFWTGEGLGVDWPGHDLAVLAFVAILLAVSAALVGAVRRAGVVRG
jgi:uncharacterized membrane protein